MRSGAGIEHHNSRWKADAVSETNPSILRLVTAYRSEWASLVEIASYCKAGKLTIDIDTISAAAKKSPGAVMAKLTAIMTALETMSQQQVIDAGEKEILSVKAKARSQNQDGLVAMNFRVTPDVKEMVLSGLGRISSAMGYGSREESWDWFNALLIELSDSEIRHLAGEGKTK